MKLAFCDANETDVHFLFVCLFLLRFRYVHPGDKNDIAAQVRMAAQCCKLTDKLIGQCDFLWTVPNRLIDQARKMNGKTLNGRRQTRKVKSLATSMLSDTSASSDTFRINSNHVHKIVV